jgi:hypothetical protein
MAKNFYMNVNLGGGRLPGELQPSGLVVGNPAFMPGKERFSAPGNSLDSMRFSAGKLALYQCTTLSRAVNRGNIDGLQPLLGHILHENALTSQRRSAAAKQAAEKFHFLKGMAFRPSKLLINQCGFSRCALCLLRIVFAQAFRAGCPGRVEESA